MWIKKKTSRACSAGLSVRGLLSEPGVGVLKSVPASDCPTSTQAHLPWLAMMGPKPLMPRLPHPPYAPSVLLNHYLPCWWDLLTPPNPHLWMWFRPWFFVLHVHSKSVWSPLKNNFQIIIIIISLQIYSSVFPPAPLLFFLVIHSPMKQLPICFPSISPEVMDFPVPDLLGAQQSVAAFMPRVFPDSVSFPGDDISAAFPSILPTLFLVTWIQRDFFH